MPKQPSTEHHNELAQVVWKNPNAPIKNNAGRVSRVVVSKHTNLNRPNASGAHSKVLKLDNSTSASKQNTVSLSFSRALQKARLQKKLTQAQLAQAVNVTPKVIQEYESGKAVPNGNQINRINQQLGVSLPSTKLSKPKSKSK